MNYTIIFKSAWQNDSWTLGKTYTSKKEAETAKEKLQSGDAKNEFFNMRIMRHRVGIEKLTDYDSWIVRFSDGTVARDLSYDPYYQSPFEGI